MKEVEEHDTCSVLNVYWRSVHNPGITLPVESRTKQHFWYINTVVVAEKQQRRKITNMFVAESSTKKSRIPHE